MSLRTGPDRTATPGRSALPAPPTHQQVASRWDLFQDRLAQGRWRVGLVGGLAVLASALAMQPLIQGGWWLPRSVVVVLAIVVVGAAVRVLRWPAPLQPLLQAVTLLVALCLLFARDAARWGILPGPAALGRLRDLAAEGRAFADATVPPAPYDVGLLLIVVAGVGLVALVVDTLASDLDLPGLTLIPLGALFVVPWIVGRGNAWGWTFAVVAAGWLGLLSAAQRDRSAAWGPNAQPGAPGVGLAVAGVATTVALLAGGVTGLRGPLTDFGFVSGLGVGGSVTVDAMVSLRRSVIGNDDRVIMTMRTSDGRPDYMRLAVLENFDGEQWTSSGTSTLGSTAVLPDDMAGTGTLQQYSIQVGPLSGGIIPSPALTISSLNDWPVVWELQTGLLRRDDGRGVRDERVGLLVQPLGLDAAGLRTASLSQSSDWYGAQNVADPVPLVGPELPALAREVTDGTETPFDAGVALQRWFTSGGGFAYSTEIEGGSDEDALATFLDERVGYCEQFAATMALMARSLGIPARVVVGFTQGRLENGQWVVRGTDAHAWPELWMGSAGWVRFEPTPGASTTTSPTYTSPRGTPYEGPTAAPSDGANQRPPVDENAPEQAAGDYVGVGDTGLLQQRIRIGSIAVLVVSLLLLPALVRLSRRVRRRRRSRGGDAEPAYQEVCDTLLDLGLGEQAATPRATMARATTAGSVRVPDPDLDRAAARILAALEWQRYGAPAGSVDAGDARSAQGGRSAGIAVLDRSRADLEQPGLDADTRVVRRALAQRASWRHRLRAALLPRSVLSGWARRITGSA